MRYIILIAAAVNLAAAISMIRDNAELRRRLAEQTDKHWECNRQIAIYSDEVTKLRRKAKWKPMKDQKGNEHYYICSRCGDWSILKKNFCGECGSDMREGEQ